MSALRSSNAKLSLNESISKFSSKLDRAIPTTVTPASRNTKALFADLDSFRNDLRNQVNTNLKAEGRPLKQEERVSPLRTQDSNKAGQEHSSAIYSDLFNAMKGVSSTKERKSFAKENISNRPSSVKEDSKIKIAESRTNPLEELSKNLFSLKNSEIASKENIKPNTLGTPHNEGKKQESALLSKLGGLKASWQLPGEEKSHRNGSFNMVDPVQAPKVGNESELSRDSIGQNRTPVSKTEKTEAPRAGGNFSELSQELDRIRNQSKKEIVQTPFNQLLLNQNPIRTSIQTTLTGTDRSFIKIQESNVDSFWEESARAKPEPKKKVFSDAIAAARIYELHSAIRDASNEEINNLPEQ